MKQLSTLPKTLFIFFTAALLIVFNSVFSYRTGPPTGLTGAPSEGDCTSCHSGTAVSNSSSIRVITNMTNGQYIPDSTYQIIIRGKKSACTRFGFETTMLNTNATPTKLGTLSVPSGSSSVQLSTGTRDYMMHTQTGTNAIYTDSTDFIINWKAPSTLSGDAKLYVALNATNADGTNGGDQIHLNAFTFPQTTNVPVASITTNVNSICQGDSVFFQGSGTNNPTSYTWTFPTGNPSTSTLQNVWVKFPLNGNKVCSLRVANAIMNSAQVTKSVQVNATPTAGITFTSVPLCEGDSIKLSTFNSTLYSYQWQLNNSNISNAISADYYAKVSGNYRVIVTSTTNCVNITAPVALTFNPKPAAVLSAPNGTTACNGDSVKLKASTGGSTYTWFNGATQVGSGTDSTYYAKGSGTYSVKVTNASGCFSTSGAVAISVFVSPSVSVNSAKNTFCQGDSSQLSAVSTDTIASYQWKKNNIDISGATGSAYYASSSGTYAVEVTTNRGCKKTSTGVSIVVNAAPVANFIDSVRSSCAFNLKIRNTGNYTYEWYRNDTLINSTDTLITATTSGIYKAKVLNATGCSTTTNSINLFIPNAPNANITPVGNAVICSDSSATYQVPATSGNTYQWYKNGNKINGATSNAYSTSDSGDYYVMVNNGVCAIASSIRNVKVNFAPINTISAADTAYCQGDSLMLAANNLSGLLYQWYKDNAVISSATKSTWYAKVPGTYKVRITQGACSNFSAPLKVYERPLPALPIISRSGSVLTSSYASGNQWYKDGLPISGATNATYTVTVHGNYAVRVTDSVGCGSISASMFVIPVGISASAVLHSLRVYPNPAHSTVTLDFGDVMQAGIVLMDASGRALKHEVLQSNTIQIDMNDLTPGIYFIKITASNDTQTVRVIKE